MAPTMVTQEMPEAHPMNGGDGLNSYSQNSSYQRGVIDAAKGVIFEAVAEKLELTDPCFDSSNPFRIADFGCSTGPNTFLAMQNIVDAVELKYNESKSGGVPEFQVFFNDHVDNDFNTLFRSLPPHTSRKYVAAGVPGSFYSRVFPERSLQFAHCSYALHWLSKVPKEIQDQNSPAWNKGRIHYTGGVGDEQVVRAYFAQFRADMDVFLKARAQEIVPGGLLMIQLPCLPNGELLFTRTGAGLLHALLGASLVDLAYLGVISEEKVDSFNLPQYHPSIEELEKVIEMNESFRIERMGTLDHPMKKLPFDVEMTCAQVRAVMEGLLKEHFGFGDEIMDRLFRLYTNKLQHNCLVFDNEIRRDVDLCLVLKRNN